MSRSYLLIEALVRPEDYLEIHDFVLPIGEANGDTLRKVEFGDVCRGEGVEMSGREQLD